ncbi:MAG: hypothetical protein LBI54_07065, partial [Lachnospiraceae bacterium]|nr:hypothetical protein [Lachnospiraceae bacterium]
MPPPPPPPAPPAYMPPPPPLEPPQPPRKKGLPFVIGAVVLALVFAGIGFFATTGNLEHWYLKNFAPAYKYYQYIEKQEAEGVTEFFLSGYDLLKAHPIDDTKTDVNVKLNLGEDALSLAKYYMDMSWLKETEIGLAANYKGDQAAVDANIKIGNESLLSVKTVLDMVSGRAYVQVPELTAQFLGVDLAGMGASLDTGNLTRVADAQRNLPETKAVEKLVQNYLGVVIGNINKVEKGSDTLEVGGVSQKCTTLTVTIDEETAQAIMEAVLTEMLTDKDLEKVLDAVYAITGYSTYYDDYRSMVERALEGIKESTDFSDVDIVMTLWVDNDGRVRGRNIQAADYEDGFYYYMPLSGKDFGYEAGVASDDGTVILSG